MDNGVSQTHTHKHTRTHTFYFLKPPFGHQVKRDQFCV